MKSKLIFGPLLIVMTLPISISHVAQAQDMAATATSLAADGFSWPIADIASMREAAQETFDLLDVNSNGSIALNEIDILKELIEGEDSLPTDELAVLRQRSNIISRTFMLVEEEIDRFVVGDTDKNGVLSDSEFELLEANVRTHILQLNIEALDSDQNGSVEFNEFSAHLDAVEELDKDGDGSLNRAELQASSNQRLTREVRLRHWQRQVREERRVQQSQRDARDRLKEN